MKSNSGDDSSINKSRLRLRKRSITRFSSFDKYMKNFKECENRPEIKIEYSDKEWYEGNYDDNYNLDGYGVFHYENGDIYEGLFKEGVREGIGEYTYEDGCAYYGEWKNDKKHGQGSFRNGKFEFDGKWENDKPVDGFTFRINKSLNNSNTEEGMCETVINDEEFDPDDPECVAKINAILTLIKLNQSIDIELVSIKNANQKNTSCCKKCELDTNICICHREKSGN